MRISHSFNPRVNNTPRPPSSRFRQPIEAKLLMNPLPIDTNSAPIPIDSLLGIMSIHVDV